MIFSVAFGSSCRTCQPRVLPYDFLLPAVLYVGRILLGIGVGFAIQVSVPRRTHMPCLLTAATQSTHISVPAETRLIPDVFLIPAQCTTLYNSEMAPARLRGAMNILFQVCSVSIWRQ